MSTTRRQSPKKKRLLASWGGFCNSNNGFNVAVWSNLSHFYWLRYWGYEARVSTDTKRSLWCIFRLFLDPIKEMAWTYLIRMDNKTQNWIRNKTSLQPSTPSGTTVIGQPLNLWIYEKVLLYKVQLMCMPAHCLLWFSHRRM